MRTRMLFLGIVLLAGWGSVGCAPVKPKEPLPEEQRQILESLRLLESQKKANITLKDLLALPPLKPLDQLTLSNPSLLEGAKAKFNEEGIGEEAHLGWYHPQLNLLILNDGVIESFKFYRVRQGQVVELGVLYGGLRDMELRLKKQGLSSEATLKEAIDAGIFDLGHIFMIDTEDSSKKKEYKEY